MKRPPAIASALLRALMPQQAFECIAGDLEEAWTAGSLSRLRYWQLALVSILSVLLARFTSRDATGAAHLLKGDGAMRSLLQDMAYGARLMRRNPVFTLAAMVTLALGIGANTAIFSILHVLILKPLDYHDPRNVAYVRAWLHQTQTMRFGLSTLEMIHLQREASTLADVAAYTYWSANLTGGDMPERVQAYRVTANLFDLLGVAPLHGRTFSYDEGRPGGREVAVLSHGLWRRRFASDPSIVGRGIMLDGVRVTIVGVMPERFEFPVFNFKGELWAPMRLDADAVLAGRTPASSAVVVARVRSGVGYAAAQAEVDAVMSRLEQEHPDTNRGRGARLAEIGTIDDEIAGPAMIIVMCAVSVVLLLACANVANLLLARGVARQRELAVRVALGAGRTRIVRQLLAESVLLSLLGGAAGAAVALIGLSGLRGALPEVVRTTQPNLDALGFNTTTLAFALVLSLVTSVVFGLLPAFRAAGPAAQEALREGAGAGGSRSTRRLRSVLVVGEVALATALLVVAGLLVRTYQQQHRIDPGFDPGNVLTLTITLPEDRYPTPDARARFFDAAVIRISAISAVQAAGFVNVLPFSTYNRARGFSIDGQEPPEPGREPSAGLRIATEGYFDVMRIPLKAGRTFDTRDGAQGNRAALVNEALVRAHFAGRDPLGARLRLGVPGSDAPPLTIVGVAGDVRHDSLTERPQPEIYLPMSQAPPAMMMLAARTAGDPEAYVPVVRAAIQGVDPSQPVYHVKSAEAMVAESLYVQMSAAAMMSLFSFVALVLASVGIYGVIAYSVSQQQHEFGVRLALGARPRDILRLVMNNGLRLVFTGIFLGGICAFAASQLLRAILYGVGPSDPVTYSSVVALLAAVGVIACCIPAWRASRTQPMAVIRLE